MANTANISVNVTANTASLESGFKRAKDAVESASESISKSISGIGTATEAATKLTLRELDSLKRATKAAETPAERFAQKQALFDKALAAGNITLAQHSKLLSAHKKGLLDTTSVFSRAGSTALHLAGYMGQTVSTIGAAAAGIQRFGGVLGGAILGAAVLKGYKAAAEFAGTLKDVAESAGLTAESLQELRYAGAQAGVDTASLDAAMTKFAVNIGKAANGSKDAVGAFAALGINVKTSNGNIKSTETILDEVAKRFGETESATQRAAMAVSLFGKGGAGMARILADGVAGLKAMRDQANALGLVLTADMVAAADRAGDRMDSLGNIIKIKLFNILLQLTPVIEPTIKGLFALGDAIVKAFGDPALSMGAEQLTQRMTEISNKIAYLRQEAAKTKSPFVDFKIEELKYEFERLNKIRAKLQFDQKERKAPIAASATIDTDAIEKDRKKLEQEADAINKAMRTPAQEIEHLNKLMGSGLTAEAYANKVRAVKEALGGMTELEVYDRKLAELNDAYKSGVYDIEEYKRAKTALDANLAGGALGEAIKAQQEYNDTIAELNRLRDNGIATDAQYSLAVENAADKLNKAKAEATLFGKISMEIGEGFADAFGEVVSGAQSASDAIRALGVQIVKSLFNQTIGKSIGNAVASGIGMLGFADGGTPPVGKVSMVGERGPELFVPKVAGTIIPNDKLGGEGGGGTTIYADMRGASVDAVQRLERFVQHIDASIEPRSVSAMINANQRNPKLLRG